jgi:hypothetical protein
MLLIDGALCSMWAQVQAILFEKLLCVSNVSIVRGSE